MNAPDAPALAPAAVLDATTAPPDAPAAPFDLGGKSAHGLRGDYAEIGADWTVEQRYAAYTPEHQQVWRTLHARQSALLPGRASSDFMRALAMLDFADAIPRFDAVNERLAKATGWTLVAVPGLLPETVFFSHLAARRFPVTVWIREPHELDYIVEPDLFHDFFGHVPLLFEPAVADYLQAYGEGGLKAERLGGLKYLARLYWYTIEFGLVRDREAGGALRAYGAGILSSPGEIRHAIESPAPLRLEFDLVRAMQTRYLIDDFQKTYFAIDSLSQLMKETEADFSLLYRALDRLPELPPDAEQPGDVRLTPAGETRPAE